MPERHVEVADLPDADALRAAAADLPAGAADGAVVYRGRNLLTRCDLAGHDAVVKRFAGGWWKALAYRFRPGKARRSFEHARRLLALGLATPRPLLLVEVRRAGFLVDSCYACEHLAGARQIREAVLDPASPGAAERLRACGAAVARMHAAGVLHRDLSAGNVLVGDDLACHLVDLNRMRFTTRPIPPGTGLRDLVALEARGPAADALLAGYAGEGAPTLRPAYERLLARRLAWWALKNRTRRWRHPFRH